ncbi:MAG: membrane protein insertion efficiency factor YidD [Bacteroidales bacterium]|nr:membrane protein insertion efficiency factor YidD [Bacteroidales bacterium]
MRAKRKTLIITLCLFFSVVGFTQSGDDIGQLKTIFDKHDHKNDYLQYVRQVDNELQLVYASIFIIYKEAFSSQDMNVCAFYPSCSEYSVQTIQKNGIIYGLFDSLDRLTRCHPLTGLGSNYPYHPETNKYYDPME